MLAHLIDFVKHFFQVFSKSFVLFVVLQAFPLFIRQLFEFITSHPFCQELFSILSEFLCSLSGPCGQLAYISITKAICQALFHYFSRYFLCVFTAVICLFWIDSR